MSIIAAMLVTAVSCNSKTEDDETEIAVTPALVAVKNFSLQKNDSVMASLDSVFFSIDLNSGVIFNADSLPKGTDVSRLIPAITFANTMSKAELIFYKDDDSEATTVNYLTNATDSIDFSKPVRLDVTAQNGVNSFSYTIKVNVHQQNPDTIIWDKLAHSTLPYRLSNPIAQKTVKHDGTVYCLVMEDDENFTIATSTDLNAGTWEIKAFDPGFYPDVESFTATPSAFYLINLTGDLYTSTDLETWTSTGQNWINIIGAYDDTILGIRRLGTVLLHTLYPRPEGYIETVLEEDFPLFGYSEMGTVESKWADRPIAFIACGMTQAGNISSKVWAYDGETWAVINYDSLPALESPMMARYVVFRDTTSALKQRQFDIWLLFGGLDFDGEMNRLVYMSYDNGVNWSIAPSGMQLPKNFPDLFKASIIVDDFNLSADLSEAWTPDSPDTRGSYTIDGFDITWPCPYLYIFGGIYPDNSLNTEIYRGVLERLTFTPLI